MRIQSAITENWIEEKLWKIGFPHQLIFAPSTSKWIVMKKKHPKLLVVGPLPKRYENTRKLFPAEKTGIFVYKSQTYCYSKTFIVPEIDLLWHSKSFRKKIVGN